MKYSLISYSKDNLHGLHSDPSCYSILHQTFAIETFQFHKF